MQLIINFCITGFIVRHLKDFVPVSVQPQFSVPGLSKFHLSSRSFCYEERMLCVLTSCLENLKWKPVCISTLCCDMKQSLSDIEMI